MTERFSCQGCATPAACCKGFNVHDIDDTLRQRHTAAAKGPIYTLMPIEDVRLPLYSWELFLLRKVAPTAFKVSPRTAFYDDTSDQPLVVSWNLDHDDCPFLGDNNTCTTYDHRMMHCRVFPLSGSGVGDASMQPSFNSLCPNINKPPSDQTDHERIQWMHETYGDTFLWTIEREHMLAWLKKTLRQAADEGLIEVRRGESLDWMKGKIGQREGDPVDFFDHIAKTDPVMKEDIDRAMQHWENLDHAKDLLAHHNVET